MNIIDYVQNNLKTFKESAFYSTLFLCRQKVFRIKIQHYRTLWEHGL